MKNMQYTNNREPLLQHFDRPVGNTIVKSQDGLVNIESLQSFLLVIHASVNGLDPIEWATTNRESLKTELLNHGAILLRNFNVIPPTGLEQFITRVFGELLDYSYASTPRKLVSGKIYTSTKYPADQSIPLHNEMAYSREWPMTIVFYCIQAPVQGGETPIADSRKLFERIDPKITKLFLEKQVMYVRNYGGGLDLPWQTVFLTARKLEVEDYCRRVGMEFEWREGDRLRTRQICQAVIKHPKTGQMVWFNQAHLFHISSLQPEIRQLLLENVSEDDLPRNAYYGDGSPIEATVLDDIRAIYQNESLLFQWHEADVLMLDNMLVAHGRAPFVGPRGIIVGMANLFTNQNV